MEIFDPYSHALASMAGYALLMIVLSAMSVAGRTAENRCECGQPKRNYDDVAYRRNRAFMNAIETAGPFVMALMAAILTGGSAMWVNIFASVFLIARIATAFVHIATVNQMLRSASWFVSVICVIALALIGVLGAF